MASTQGAPPKVAVGGHEAFERPSGIGRYQAQVVGRLASRLDLTVFMHRPLAEYPNAAAPPFGWPTAKVQTPGRSVGRGRLARGLLANPYLWTLNRDVLRANVATRLAEGAAADDGGFALYHGTGSYMPITRKVRARVITVHDVTPVTMPERHARVTVKGFLKPRELRETDHVIMGSESSRTDFFTVFKHPAERTHVIPYGVDHEVFRPAPQPVESSPPYIISVGMIEPRKNLVRGLAAFEAVAKEAPDLRWKVVGPKGWGWSEFESALAASPARARVDVAGPLDDASLAAAYRGARCLFFPSLWEGFGIPVVEALASGTRVACSNLPPLASAVGERAELFDPLDTQAMAEALRKVCEGGPAREAAIRLGIERAAQFDWEASADAHISVYAAALDCPRDELLLPKAGG